MQTYRLALCELNVRLGQKRTNSLVRNHLVARFGPKQTELGRNWIVRDIALNAGGLRRCLLTSGLPNGCYPW